MSRVSLWFACASFFASLAFSLAMEVGKEWFIAHGFLVWWSWGATALFALLTVAEFERQNCRIQLAKAFEKGRASVASQTHLDTATASNPKPVRPPRMSGHFFRVNLVRQGLITENRDDKQRWLLCGFAISVSLSNSGGPALIEDVQLRTHKNRPPCQSLTRIAPPQVCELPERANHIFQVYPQCQFLYEGKRKVPESLEMVIVDQYKVEHLIHLKDGEQLPILPSE